MESTDNSQDNQDQKEPEKVEENKVEQAPEQEASGEQSQPEETPEQINWRKVREKQEIDKQQKAKDDEKREKAETEAAHLRAALEVIQKPTPNQGLSEEDKKIIAELAEDDITTAGDVKNIVSKQVSDALKNAFQEHDKKQQEQKEKEEKEEMPKLLREKHEDFDEIVNQDNIAYLRYHHPEISDGLSHQPNQYKMWSSVYSAIKKLVPNPKKSDSDRIESNSLKPQTINSAMAQPSGEAHQGRTLTQAEKDANYARMVKLARAAR